MPRLEIALLGYPQIRLNGKLVDNLPAKSQALLYYLVLTKQQFSRDHLAELLWSNENMPLEKKKNNLRGNGALLPLTRDFNEFLFTERHSLAFRTESDYGLDVDAFEVALRDTNPTQGQLQTAVNLYRDDFLAGLTLRNAAGFDEWSQRMRERLRRLAMNALYLLAVHYKQQQQYPAGIDCITRLLALEPYFEEAHREMMIFLGLTGQVSEACNHYERYEAFLADDGLEPEQETLAVYQQLVRGEIGPDEASQPVIPTEPSPQWSPPFQPPARIPHFVGRQALKKAILSNLKKDTSAGIQAVVGMGGIGKSSLAIEIAHDAQSQFPDGILWASVATSEPTAVLESWAMAYGYDFSRIGELDSMANAFRSVLADKQVLLVLDDVSSVARIRPLLPNGDNVRVLLTTRDQDLAYAVDAEVWLLAELSPENGRALLTNILGEDRIAAEDEAAAELCDLLQNLPLALEIIGQRLKSRPRRKLADIVQRLRDEKQRLSELHISDREVRASFALSHATLDAGLKEMFALMGVFNGRSFTAETLAAIAAQDRYEAEDRIFALVALSLAQEEGNVRYIQHPLLADFAREKLQEREDEGEVYGRVAHTYLQFAQQYQHDYDALRPEWDNLMAAMEAAHNYELWQTVIDFADALHDAWFTRARYSEARQGFKLVSKAAKNSNNKDDLALSLLNWAIACIEQNDYIEAEDLLTSSLKISKEANNQYYIANTQFHLARIALEHNDYENANMLLKKSKQIREQLKDEIGIAAIDYRQARIFYRQGIYNKAEHLAIKALNTLESLNEKRESLPILRLLSAIALVRKDYNSAETFCKQALGLSKELQDQGELAATLSRLSDVNRRLGRFHAAEEYARESLILFQRMGDRKLQGLALYSLSVIKEDMQEYQASLEICLKSKIILEDIKAHYDIVLIMIHLGDIYTHLGKKQKAREIWLNGLNLAQNQFHPEINTIEQRLR